MILLIDNYDSFSYNLYQQIGSVLRALRAAANEPAHTAFVIDQAPEEILVIRNDAITTDEIETLSPSHLVLSPGPGCPADAGVCIEAVRRFAGLIPILGVCLGHQAICEAFGATVSYAKELMHGKSSLITVDGACPIFSLLPPRIEAARYHSLAAIESTMPPELAVTAWTDDGEIMAVAHRDHPVYGVQFHPESILTPKGSEIMKNFLSIESPAALPESEKLL
ncbi:MAG: aminodeoxychorismate/anthranilate synthase component II [Clostridiales Family XIII bacterium]|jgi:anthranilate synthase component 2|nr:aminodeoxychorismate/anthranilate synthase component II [Clostridiales Family XIII bacterium]